MKIYILADMEGISGIRSMGQVKRDNPGYPAGCKLMMDDINVAIDACFAAGASEVVACDTHGGGGQVQVDNMDPRATYETPAGGRMMPSLDDSFAGVILLGHHAMAGTINGFLDHTMSSMAFWEYRCNGKALGEMGIEAAFAGHYDVPVIAMSGDEAAAAEAMATFGAIECAIVKRGLGRNKANCLSIPTAHEAIRTAVTNAVGAIDTYTPFKPELPATIELTLYRTDMADDLAVKPGIERVNARTVRRKITSLLDVFTW